MITANMSFGRLIHIKPEDKYKYNYFYTAESYYVCCQKNCSSKN